MSLKERISEDLKTSMKARNQQTTSVLRMILSEVKYAQAATNVHADLDDAAVEKVVSAYQKRLVKSLDEYPLGEARTKIEEEIAIVNAYLPKKAGADEINKVIEGVLGATVDRQFGAVMKQVMAKLGSSADGKLVSDLIKKHLS